MIATPKRRWILAIVALSVVVLAVGFIFFREDPHDVPRLVIVKQEDIKSKRPVVFRLDAPKHSDVMVFTMSPAGQSIGQERRTLTLGDDVLAKTLVDKNPQRARFFLVPKLQVKAGQSEVFHVLPPTEDVWRLRLEVFCPSKYRLKELRRRVRMCWREKSLAPLRYRMHEWPWEILESEPITNSVARAVDAPRA